jgi:alkylhydroperoxidase family enzyme
MVTETVTRIAPVQPPFPVEVAEQLAAMMPAGEPPIALFRTFAHNMPMTRAMHGWGVYTLGRTFSVTMRLREIAIVRTCARCGCEYEWGIHVARFARRVGLTDQQIESLTYGRADDACWSDLPERLLIQLVDVLHDHSDIDDSLWTRLAEVFNAAQLLDLMLLTGWYHAISYVGRAARVASEPGTPRFADYLPVS